MKPPSPRAKGPILPPPTHLCQCYDCVNGTCTDPLTGFLIRGRWVDKATLSHHNSLTRSRGIASAKSAAAAIGIPRPTFIPPQSRSLSQMLNTPVCSVVAPSEPEVTYGIPPSRPNLIHEFHSSPRSSYPRVAAEAGSRKRKDDRRTSQFYRSGAADALAAIQRLKHVMESTPKFDFKSIRFSRLPTSALQHADPDDFWNLQSDIPANVQLLAHQSWMLDSLKFVSDMADQYGRYSTSLRLSTTILKRLISEELDSLERSLRAEWDRQRWVAVEASTTYVDMSKPLSQLYLYFCALTGHYAANFIKRPFASINPTLLASYLLAATLYLFCGVSMIHCNFVLRFFQVFSAALDSRPPTTSITDIRTVVKALSLERPFTSFISCPKCHYLYGYTRGSGDFSENVPEHCTNREHPDSEPCSRRLRKPRKRQGTNIEAPTREFLYQDLPQWVGWMYSRPDIEKLLDEDPTSRPRMDGNHISDIWDASGLREFLGPDGRTPFYQRPGSEGRLIFSLNVDGFNPYSNKQAGKTVSTGGIYMICLNLPESIRYKVENMYLVGIIPGPHGPSLHQINYLLKPLVDDLLNFWNTGFFYSHTTSFPQGRWVRCALVPLVCDLPAARQVAGFGHHRANQFCSFCHQTLQQINDIDSTNWKPREPDDHRKMALEWRNAQTKHERDTLYSKNGVRWSELLRLPYWNPIQFTVIDSMHSFFLRMLSRHCREIWGMNVKLVDGDGPTFSPDKNEPSEDEMKAANDILLEGTITELKALRVAVLRKLCEIATTLDFRGGHSVLLNRLVQFVSWVNNQVIFTSHSSVAN